MKLREELDAEKISEGFTPQNDIFERKNLAARLTGLFEQIEGGSVCLLDGRWGSGKSTFVKQWAAELRRAGRPAIYFDAFASDYIETPFEAIAAAFIQEAARAGKTEEPAYKTFLKRAASVGRIVSGVAAKAGVKAATLGIVGKDELESMGEIKDALIDGAADVAEKAVEKMLEAHTETVGKFEELRRAISALPSLLSASEDGYPLIVFIDELDRCRPDFALGILETLKHFFRTDNVHFVLVTNRSYLELSVSHRYGAGLASREYLEKFFDFSIQFELIWERHETGSIDKYINYTIQRLLPKNLKNVSYIVDVIRSVCRDFKLSLRESETFIINVAISLMAARDNEFRPAAIVTYLCLLKAKRPDLFSQARNGSLDIKEFSEYILQNSSDPESSERVIKIFRYYGDPNVDVNSEDYRGWGSDLWNYNLEHDRVIPYIANAVVERFGAPSQIFLN